MSRSDILGSSDLFLNLSAKLQGRRHAIKRLERSAGSADHDRAIAEDSSGDALIHANTLDLVQKHLRRFFLNKSGFKNDPLICYRELRARSFYLSDDDRNDCDHDNPRTRPAVSLVDHEAPHTREYKRQQQR